ncbi:MAG: hypothetical protein INH41_08840 [Myxococcaceae bacterium]|jgi:hypothetical protein|nr:hypothetical protein [Myxococcaceae bacterium]MCA3012490.1 hypothetical protein [Myxococcaceae bacterium]
MKNLVSTLTSLLLVPTLACGGLEEGPGDGAPPQPTASTSAPLWGTGGAIGDVRCAGFYTDRRLFTGFTPAPVSWARNPASWVSALDFSGVSAGILGRGGVGGGTLITRQHVLMSAHVGYPELPFKLYFVDNARNTYEYQVTRLSPVPGTDLQVGTLNQPVSPALRVYRVLPGNWRSCVRGLTNGPGIGGVPTSSFSPGLPVLFVDQSKTVSTGDLTQVLDFSYGPSFNAYPGSVADVVTPALAASQACFTAPRGGDSGNPIFVQQGGELVLLGGWFQASNGVGRFAWLADHRQQVEMVTGPLATVDLSSLRVGRFMGCGR